jgi:uncharacterized SAM-binding protein YcdF (DUF218 family)
MYAGDLATDQHSVLTSVRNIVQAEISSSQQFHMWREKILFQGEKMMPNGIAKH